MRDEDGGDLFLVHDELGWCSWTIARGRRGQHMIECVDLSSLSRPFDDSVIGPSPSLAYFRVSVDDHESI